jgi:hypothetical protein
MAPTFAGFFTAPQHGEQDARRESLRYADDAAAEIEGGLDRAPVSSSSRSWMCTG